MVSKCAVGNVIIDQKQTSRIAAVPVKLNKIWVINRGQNQDFVAEGFSGEGFVATVVFTMKVKIYQSGQSMKATSLIMSSI
ncbi:hypothetical protein CUMW_022740 [Citrus unshiu]|nr:hypothetical protein CUMW_022740 [Citrus unshiu]